MGGEDWPSVAELQEEGVILVEDGNHGEYRPLRDEFVASGVAFVRAADMSDGAVDFSACEHINDAAFSRIRKGIGRPNDILLSHKGTVGKLARVPNDAPPFVCSPQTTFWRILKVGVIDRGYLYAFMRSPLFASQLAAVQGETDMAPYVSLTAQRRLKIALPKMPEQVAIGHFLGALDDKIELNRRMAETLEAMARALFKSWFVDFDPVRAKEEGRPTDLPDEVVALFPQTLDRLHQVPTGWSVSPLGDVVELAYGKALKAESRQPGAIPVFGSNGQVGLHDVPLAKGPGIVVGRKGNPGTVIYVHVPFFCIDTTFYVAPKSPDTPFSYLWLLLENANLPHLTGDSAVPGLNREAAYSREVVVPTNAALVAFDGIVGPLLQRLYGLRVASQTLVELRDTLLPRLISGELRIRDAESEIEAA